MGEYKIAHFPTENEWSIMRVDGDDVWWLSPEKIWTKNKQRAKRFYHKESAMSALVTIRTQGELEEEKPYRPDEVKQSWDEL